MRTEIADRLKQAVSVEHRRQLTMTRLRIRRSTARWRDFPAFLIIGAERGGTSSLYKYLGRYPRIAPSLRKETEYFNRYFDRGEDWYRAHFPLEIRARFAERLGKSLLPFEATPAYMLDPRVPARAAALVPDAKLIVMLRDPIGRALSGWRHMTKLGFETLSFQEAVEAEEVRLAGELDRMLDDPPYFSRPYFRFSYLERGKYAEQLRGWFAYFDRQQFLVIESEEFFANTRSMLNQMLTFLGLEGRLPIDFKNYSDVTSQEPARAAQEVPNDTYAKLERYFAPHNRSLVELLGREFSWT